MDTKILHARRIAEALSDVEAGEAGNDHHYRAIKVLADAVRFPLSEPATARQMSADDRLHDGTAWLGRD